MHCFQTPGVALIGRQCHIQPEASLSAPVLAVFEPYLELVVSFLVASFAKVVMMSVAWHEQSSPVSRYGECLEHSAQAPPIVGSACPGPFGALAPKRSAASAPEKSANARTKAVVDFIAEECGFACGEFRSG